MAYIGRYPEKTKALARSLAAGGMSVYDIARQIGCGDCVVKRWLDDEYRQKYNRQQRERLQRERGYEREFQQD